MAFVNEHARITERQNGLILPVEVGKWIKAVYASADADIETIVFVFDAQVRLSIADAEIWNTGGRQYVINAALCHGEFYRYRAVRVVTDAFPGFGQGADDAAAG
jgi:hypothetical protein